ncbi:DctQ9 protein [Candidatus Vecturithrix granuli]|uniref:DctQ9 protein n=1 Tax=Vecturithrix granuli TaxID=1499967 RepID=A0A081BVL3_VECG1|nr:DctQ9 protein [Candidatus Vecturithrix granuli]
MENLPSISRVIHRVMVPVIFVLGMAMFLVVIAQVIFRYILLRPLPWSEELARYLMVWGACLAASEAYASGNHVGVTIIINAIKPGMRKIMTMVIHLAVALLMAVIVYQGFVLSFLLHDQLSPALEIPMTVPYLAVPVGAGLILIQAVVLFFKQMRESPTDVTIHSELE